MSNDREKLTELCFLEALMLVVFVAALLLFSTFGYFLGFPLTRVQPLASLALVLLLPFILRTGRSLGLKWKLAGSAIFVVVLGFSFFLASSFVDFTCDGQGYHGTGMLQLLEGWNPIRDPGHAEAPQSLQREVMIHYAKGPWIVAAALCTLVGKVEAGKATTLLLIAACFLLALHAGLKYSRLGAARLAILSLIIALNPISLSQCLSFYVDGQVAAIFTCMALAGCLVLKERGTINIALTALTIVILINVKLTALIYVAVFGITFTIGVCILRKLEALRHLFAAYAIGILLGLAVGYNPYITNLRETGNPFFPFTLEKTKHGTEENFVVHQMPTTFRGRNRFETFLRSVFGRCWNGYDDASLTFTGSPLKVPFTVGADELKWFETVDVRICGWGPLTSGVLLFALVAFCVGTRSSPREHRRLAVLLACCVLATIFAMPHPWYARYVPQLWLLPVITAVVLLLNGRRLPSILGSILILLMAANLLFVSVPCFQTSIAKTKLMHSQLRWLARQNRVFPVAFGDYVFNRRRFQEWNIKYRPVEVLPPEAKQMVLAGDTSSKTVISLEE